ncbi:alkyl hydroperoxide reductase/thiol specific antioxidant/Mal allergen [Fibrisoma limi BUZ 3]|uniref:Alkyl hydroperoxide reductase/thiol specific antioxidant/Mal allergen n=1 Tax=Fibrisoma limi BUZ 3 TaxID=1185876 RepID=I2GDA0_9BACT|nr:TlpA disulfide reductase family protein [Fibrisoma limi]CCH51874.1 alkyl hydroperoxide reductase/thiol specific antioxidant/Mal allergen [Fibrisoma limi BUZ 3]
MFSSPFRTALVLGSTLVCLLVAGKPSLYAQNRSLKQCSETIRTARQAATDRNQPHQFPSLTLFSPASQKLEQSYLEWSDCVKGQKAPVSAFKTMTGESYDTAALAGKVVVINFWFMSCAPCRAEMPALNKLVDEYRGKDVLFFGFTPDKTDRLKPEFFEKTPFNFNIVADAQRLADSFAITGYPTTYVVDGQGIIQQAWIGVDSRFGPLDPYYKAKAAIDNLLGATGK